MTKLAQGRYELKSEGRTIRVFAIERTPERLWTGRRSVECWEATINGQNRVQGAGSKKEALRRALELIEKGWV